MIDFKKLFSPVESIDAAKLKDFMDTHPAGSYNLLDVRQPSEYKEHHLPGSKLIPLAELERASSELDPTKPTVVY